MATKNTPLHIGQTVRSLRLEAKLTGGQLGERVGISQSKISKIETGYYARFDQQEINKILNALDASQTIRQQVALAMESEQVEIPWHGRFKLRYDYQKGTYLNRAKRTIQFRSFLFALMPVLLQTLEYRQAMLAYYDLNQSDIQLALKECAIRQEILWDRQHHFHFIMHETALYNMVADKSVQRVQLDKIERFMGLSNVKIGIIPLLAGLSVLDHGSFALHDNRLLICAIGAGETETDQADNIAEYHKLFARLEQKADYGDAARKLIRQAIDHFT